jgi:hypothetical protein
MIIEMCTYHCAPGRMPALQERFKNHTIGFFEKYGIKPLGFWTTVVGNDNQFLAPCAFFPET